MIFVPMIVFTVFGMGLHWFHIDFNIGGNPVSLDINLILSIVILPIYLSVNLLVGIIGIFVAALFYYINLVLIDNND